MTSDKEVKDMSNIQQSCVSFSRLKRCNALNVYFCRAFLLNLKRLVSEETYLFLHCFALFFMLFMLFIKIKENRYLLSNSKYAKVKLQQNSKLLFCSGLQVHNHKVVIFLTHNLYVTVLHVSIKIYQSLLNGLQVIQSLFPLLRTHRP